MTSTELLFNGANLFVLPFWALMIILPKWGLTKKIIASPLPLVALALLYGYFFINSLDPETAEALSSPELSAIASAFSDNRVMATGWVHYLVMDLFVGRWIYQEGLKTGVWTIHSLILCLFAGPLGLLSHLTTQWVTDSFFSKPETEPTAAAN